MSGEDIICEWVSAQVIAETYGVSKSTVLRLARRGVIPSVRVGGQRRFDLHAVEEVFLQDGKGEKEVGKE